MFDLNALAFVTDEIYNAPFVYYGGEEKRRLVRLGVIDVDNNPCEQAIGALARAFAVTFMEGIEVCYDDNPGEIIFIQSVMSDLWDKKDVKAMYLYLALRCGVLGISVIKQDLIWIARHENLLRLYLGYFIDELGKLIDDFDTDEEKAE